MQNNPFMPNATNMPTGSMPTPNTAIPASDSFEVDLTEVTDSYVIPDGNYKVKCVNVEQGVSKGGNPQFIWDFVIAEGKYMGFATKVFTAITPAAMWKVAETVQALGVGQTGQVVKFKRTDVVGKECGAVIEKTEYNGKERSQVSRLITLKELAESNA